MCRFPDGEIVTWDPVGMVFDGRLHLAEREEGIVRDIDLAIESTDFLRASGWLLSLPEAIDVVDLNELYPHIRERVETKGRVLYERIS